MTIDVLLDVAAKSTLVLAAACAIAAAVRRKASAATRYLVWAAALGAVLLLPVLVMLGPAWSPSWLPRSSVFAARASSPLLHASNPPGGEDRGDASARDPRAGRADAGARPVDVETLFAFRSASLAARTSTWLAVVPVLWLAGLVVAVLRLAAGLIWAAAIARRAAPLTSPDWVTAAAAAAETLGLDKSVPLRMSARTNVPVALGLVRPQILMPIDAEHWPIERRRVVLLHELAHVKRRDCLVQAVGRLACAVHWINPLAHLSGWRLRAEQERACDDLVLEAGVPPADYAQHLCEIATGARRALFPAWATLAMSRSSRLERRVRAILDRTRRRQGMSARRAAAAIATAAIAVVPIGALQLVQAAPRAENPGGSATARSADIESRALSLQQPEAADAPGAILSSNDQPRDPAGLRKTLDDYCAPCHGAQRKAAGLDVSALDLERIVDEAARWEKIVRKIRSGTHPPVTPTLPHADRPTLDALVSWVESSLDRGDAGRWTPDRAQPLSDQELSERLARFLWGSAPDADLRAAARRGELQDGVALGRQVRRMLQDGRSSVMLDRFFGQWLYLRNIDGVKPDPGLFPEFDDALRQAFRRETELFIASQVRDDRGIPELLSANYTFLNDRLARHYGIPNVSGSHFRRVALRDDARSGLLGQGSILTVTSYANRTSPVLRGKFVLETMLGTPPPPPPPNVPALKEPAADAPATMRGRMEEAVKHPACASCHTVMDAFGFALENFDAIGQWRDTERGRPIDASGVLEETSFNGPAQFRIALLQRSDAFVRTVTERLLAFAVHDTLEARTIGRPEDMPAVRTIVADSTAAGHRWSGVITALALSKPFQMKRLAP